MWFHLRFAALVSACWVVVLVLQPIPGAAELSAWLSALGTWTLALAHALLATLFAWGGIDPPRRLVAVYVGLAVFALRSTVGVYLVLEVLPPAAAMVWMVEMVLSIGLLSAIINGLPNVLRRGDDSGSDIIATG